MTARQCVYCASDRLRLVTTSLGNQLAECLDCRRRFDAQVSPAPDGNVSQENSPPPKPRSKRKRRTNSQADQNE